MFEALRALVTVVSLGSVSEAARALHVTQPTVTRQIQQLERQFGQALFDRSGKRLALTPAGERVHAYALEVLRKQEELAESLLEMSNPEAGLVRIGAGLSPTLYRLPALVARYASIHPRVRFQVVTGSSKVTLERLASRAVDLAIVTTPPDGDAGVELVALWRDELVAVAPSYHALAGKRATIAELAEHPLVVMHGESGLRRQIDELLHRAGVDRPAPPVMETDSLEAMNRFVQAGLGLAVVPWPAVADDVTEGRLKLVHIVGCDLGQRTVTLVWRKESHIPAAARAFLRWLASQQEAVSTGLR
ncbi:LysR family transcriptional regulator [Alicyclobacillus vulcanalis]|uniref:DNA-binding transcriptional regulator, LysR family n=1 Tax=Alicyclobacillus vulcanalis TaxID=252246 RepID=A0A1N7K8M1_9BACL|nr:LysR family transcriptional regulator [Alicyclobacillus vulcanalis]SIS57804.1 DNA-binding transcriptional regulator, LysR family [Alicyclobacillus vulcanalis]